MTNAQKDPAAVAYVAAVMVTSDAFAKYIDLPEHENNPVNDYFRQAADWAVEFLNHPDRYPEDPGHVEDDDIYEFTFIKTHALPPPE